MITSINYMNNISHNQINYFIISYTCFILLYAISFFFFPMIHKETNRIQTRNNTSSNVSNPSIPPKNNWKERLKRYWNKHRKKVFYGLAITLASLGIITHPELPWTSDFDIPWKSFFKEVPLKIEDLPLELPKRDYQSFKRVNRAILGMPTSSTLTYSEGSCKEEVSKTSFNSIIKLKGLDKELQLDDHKELTSEELDEYSRNLVIDEIKKSKLSEEIVPPQHIIPRDYFNHLRLMRNQYIIPNKTVINLYKINREYLAFEYELPFIKEWVHYQFVDTIKYWKSIPDAQLFTQNKATSTEAQSTELLTDSKPDIFNSDVDYVDLWAKLFTESKEGDFHNLNEDYLDSSFKASTKLNMDQLRRDWDPFESYTSLGDYVLEKIKETIGEPLELISFIKEGTGEIDDQLVVLFEEEIRLLLEHFDYDVFLFLGKSFDEGARNSVTSDSSYFVEVFKHLKENPIKNCQTLSDYENYVSDYWLKFVRKNPLVREHFRKLLDNDIGREYMKYELDKIEHFLGYSLLYNAACSYVFPEVFTLDEVNQLFKLYSACVKSQLLSSSLTTVDFLSLVLYNK